MEDKTRKNKNILIFLLLFRDLMLVAEVVFIAGIITIKDTKKVS